MFGDTLLESSSVVRKNKRWPMATAFMVEAIVAAVIVIVPLLSTGAIPVFARPPIYTPIKSVTLERVPVDHPTPIGPAGPTRSREVVSMNNRPDVLRFCDRVDPRNERTEPGLLLNANIGLDRPVGDLIPGSGPAVRPGSRPIISVLSEAQLLKRVEPVYPHIAAVSGIQGQVKLHAIIARDGSIQSLNAISGHPLLVRAAMDAVEQWRYRPYVLNGERVEVETLITVIFRRDAH